MKIRLHAQGEAEVRRDELSCMREANGTSRRRRCRGKEELATQLEELAMSVEELAMLHAINIRACSTTPLLPLSPPL